ncbi:MAG: prolyl oligopeptidase family serine peptidase [Gemmatimonadales bacterium]
MAESYAFRRVRATPPPDFAYLTGGTGHRALTFPPAWCFMMTRSLRVLRYALSLVAPVVLALPLAAQGPRPLTQADFDGWKSITGTALSSDGRWVAYTITPQVGDGEMVFRATTGSAEHRHSRGFTGRPQLQPGATAGTGAAFTAAAAQWAPTGSHAAFLVYPNMDASERARRARTRPADAPKNGLGVFTAATGTVEVIPRVRTFELPSEAGSVLIHHMEADSGTTTPPARPDSAARAGAAPDSAGRPAAPRRPDPGTTLVIRDLRTGQETRIEEVTAFAMDDSAKWLAYTVTSREAEQDGAYLRSLATGTVTQLLSGSGAYAALTFDRAGRQLAFLSDREDTNRDKPKHRLYHATLQGNTVRVMAVATPDSAGAGMQIATGQVGFTRDGSALRFGIQPVPPDSIPADSLAESAVYDLWHWQDPQLQPQQRLQARQVANRAYAALYRLATRRITRLGNDTLLQVTISDDGRHALATTNLPYAISAMWGQGGNDVYLIDATTGARTRIIERLDGGAQFSPGGQFVSWFQDGHWHARHVASGRVVNLTAGIDGISFAQETWDTPSTPSSWGAAGWTTNDRSLLVYDRYDVWELDPAGARAPRTVTESAGRRGNITYRLVRTDTEERHLDPTQPVILRAFDNHTKQSGYFSGRIDRVESPQQIVMADVAYGTPQKAKQAEVYVTTRSTFREFPDLWAGTRLDQLSKISNANPQQGEIAWGTAELVAWRSDDNEPLQGILYKPDGFDPSRQYPMVVYFYEKLSDNLHNYNMAYPRNTTQPTWYVSNGYLVFFPDINYGTGFPGPDALKSVVPGVQSLIAKGFVDPKAVGVAGQSWGGYQIAHMITRSNIFTAAMAGAPVANMTSAYGGIRWASGLARAFQYETGQSRIGGSLWESPLRYLENSPLFHADRIETPLLMMHNDNDGAVPWYQGIEMFVAMRRLGKEVYMVNYNGDEHNPTKRANQADIAKKTMEFFDHHLRGKPMPRWMVEGIPFLEKGRR